MQELQRWWRMTMRSILGWLAAQWSALVRGITYEWPVAYFILAMGILLAVALVGIWHKGTNR